MEQIGYQGLKVYFNHQLREHTYKYIFLLNTRDFSAISRLSI